MANQPEQPGIITYATNSDEGLKRIFGSSSDLRISYKGSSLNDISRINVWVSNASKKSADNVRIYLELKDKTRQAIVADYDVPEGSPRDIVKPLPFSNGIYPFEIKYMNRNEEILDGYRFSLLFIGSRAPEIEVKMAAKDLTLQKKDSPFSLDRTRLYVKTFGSLWWLLALYVPFFFLFTRYERTQQRIREARTKDILETITSSPIPPGSAKEEYLIEVRDNLLKTPSFIDVVKATFKQNA